MRPFVTQQIDRNNAAYLCTCLKDCPKEPT